MSARPLRIAIFGATSAIALGAARRWADDRARLVLVGRNPRRLEAAAADLRLRGAEVAVQIADFDLQDSLASAVDAAWQAFGGLDIALVAHGVLADQPALDRDVAAAMRVFHTNANSAIALLLELAQRFEVAGSGAICAIGSVAGDRGRASNYVYGSAKSAVATTLQGLRQRLAPRGVAVITIKPGLVDTPMTAGFTKGPLWSTPDAVGRRIVEAIAARHSVVYIPGFWRFVMAVLRALPESIFLKLRI